MTTNMYRENRQTLNWFVGCRHGCVYCKPSFQRQMKRQLHNCLKCYNYEPHAHLERLLKLPPKTEGNEFIFFPSSGDPAFATHSQFQTAIDYAEKYEDRPFLIQSKAPACFHDFEFPDNVILDITLETDITIFGKNPSRFTDYRQISKAPIPIERMSDFSSAPHHRKGVTVEPILLHNPQILSAWIEMAKPEFVYVGYDNHDCHLPEPTLDTTYMLIELLEKFTEVRVKTLRKAWYEK